MPSLMARLSWHKDLLFVRLSWFPAVSSFVSADERYWARSGLAQLPSKQALQESKATTDQALSLKQWVLPDLSQVRHMCTRDSFEKGNTGTLQFWPGPAQPRRPITSEPVPGKYCCTLLIKSSSVIPYSAWSKQWKGLEASNLVSQEPLTVQNYKVVLLLHSIFLYSPAYPSHYYSSQSDGISACSLKSSQAIHWWWKVDCVLTASTIISSFNHVLQ